MARQGRAWTSFVRRNTRIDTHVCPWRSSACRPAKQCSSTSRWHGLVQRSRFPSLPSAPRQACRVFRLSQPRLVCDFPFYRASIVEGRPRPRALLRTFRVATFEPVSVHPQAGPRMARRGKGGPPHCQNGQSCSDSARPSAKIRATPPSPPSVLPRCMGEVHRRNRAPGHTSMTPFDLAPLLSRNPRPWLRVHVAPRRFRWCAFSPWRRHKRAATARTISTLSKMRSVPANLLQKKKPRSSPGGMTGRSRPRAPIPPR